MILTTAQLALFVLVTLSVAPRNGYSHSTRAEHGNSEHLDDSLSNHNSRSYPMDDIRDFGNEGSVRDGLGGNTAGGSVNLKIMDIVNQLISQYGRQGGGEEAKVKEIINQVAGPIIQRVVTSIENLFNKGGSGQGLPFDIGRFMHGGKLGGSAGHQVVSGLDNSDKPSIPPDYSDPSDGPAKGPVNEHANRYPSMNLGHNSVPNETEDKGPDPMSEPNLSTVDKSKPTIIGDYPDSIVGDSVIMDGPKLPMDKPDKVDNDYMDKEAIDEVIPPSNSPGRGQNQRKKGLPPLGVAKPWPNSQKIARDSTRSIPSSHHNSNFKSKMMSKKSSNSSTDLSKMSNSRKMKAPPVIRKLANKPTKTWPTTKKP